MENFSCYDELVSRLAIFYHVEEMMILQILYRLVVLYHEYDSNSLCLIASSMELY